jgi:hypothetical protein
VGQFCVEPTAYLTVAHRCLHTSKLYLSVDSADELSREPHQFYWQAGI